MVLSDLLVAIEAAAPIVAFNESFFAYPVIEGLHLLSLSVAFGLLAVADLRLAGLLFRDQPVDALVGALRPWFVGGFVVVLATGLVLFLARITFYVATPLFWAKIGLIVLGALNALYFEIHHRTATAGQAPRSRWALSHRASGLISLSVWVTVIALGRLLAYFQSKGV